MNVYDSRFNVEFLRLEGVSEENAMKEEAGEEKREWGAGREREEGR